MNPIKHYKTINYKSTYALFYVFFVLSGNLLAQNNVAASNFDSISYYTNKIYEANKQAKFSSENTYNELIKSYHFFKSKKQNEKSVQCLITMADLQKKKGKMSLSFDHLWEALYLIENTNNDAFKAIVNRKLSQLYDAFNKKEKSLFHSEQALLFSKNLLLNNNKPIQLSSSYLGLAIKQRKINNYDAAISYLDSCVSFQKRTKSDSYVTLGEKLERANIHLIRSNYKFANTILQKLKKSDNTSKQNIRIYYYLGLLKLKLKEQDSAIYYFEKSFDLINFHYEDKNFAPNILASLSKMYAVKNQNKKAYSLLLQKNKIADSLSQIKTAVYSELFEIKNTYLSSLQEKESLLTQQNSIIEKNHQTQFWLKIIIFLVLILSSALFFISRIRIKLKKTLLEKKEAEMESDLSKEKSQAKIKLKSKELTSYALQLIDKDSAIDELLKVLKEAEPSSYKSLSNKYKKGAADLWNEFNLRFTEVNLDFYNRLKIKHPNFTPTEQKHLALIKLKFSTKEMARILNIEPHSVHISRSRIRKKIGLERNESLENYVNDL